MLLLAPRGSPLWCTCCAGPLSSSSCCPPAALRPADPQTSAKLAALGEPCFERFDDSAAALGAPYLASYAVCREPTGWAPLRSHFAVQQRGTLIAVVAAMSVLLLVPVALGLRNFHRGDSCWSACMLARCLLCQHM